MRNKHLYLEENDSTDTLDGQGDIADSLGNENDSAFARGRTYAKYSPRTAERSAGKHPKEYLKEFMRGYRWQRSRNKFISTVNKTKHL